MKPQDILEAVALIFGLSVEQLRGRSREREAIYARQAAMLLLRDYAPILSAAAIGRLLGKRDHTTVLYGVTAARKRGYTQAWYQRMTLDALNAARERAAA